MAPLLTGCVSQKPSVSLETLAGNEAMVVDTKANVGLGKGVGVFARNISTTQNGGKTNNFALADVYFPMAGGIEGVVEGQFIPGQDTNLRVGAQYFTDFGGSDFSLYARGTASVNGDGSNYEVLLSPSYQVGENVSLGVECLTNMGEEGHNFTTFNPRANYSISIKIDLGIGANSFTADGTTDWNIGPYIKISL